jgi:hypothetical protein
MRSRIHRPSPAMVVASLALVFAMGGTTWAVTSLPANSVGIAQLRTGAVTNTKIGSRAVSNAKLRAASVSATKIAKDAVTGGDVKNGALTGFDLKDNTLTGTQVAESKLGIVPSATKAAAVTGVTVLKSAHIPEASDEAGAPMTILGSRGDVAFYAKCFRDADGTSTDARIYFSVLPGHTALYNTGAAGYVTAATAETARVIQSAKATTGSVDGDTSTAVFRATTGTTTISGVIGDVFAKNGAAPGGDGPFGPGNSCIVGSGGLFG